MPPLKSDDLPFALSPQTIIWKGKWQIRGNASKAMVHDRDLAFVCLRHSVENELNGLNNDNQTLHLKGIDLNMWSLWYNLDVLTNYINRNTKWYCYDEWINDSVQTKLPNSESDEQQLYTERKTEVTYSVWRLIKYNQCSTYWIISQICDVKYMILIY